MSDQPRITEVDAEPVNVAWLREQAQKKTNSGRTRWPSPFEAAILLFLLGFSVGGVVGGVVGINWPGTTLHVSHYRGPVRLTSACLTQLSNPWDHEGLTDDCLTQSEILSYGYLQEHPQAWPGIEASPEQQQADPSATTSPKTDEE